MRMETPWLNDNLTEAIKSDINFIEKCHDIAADLQGQKLKLVMLVERLGAVLTDKDPELRARGTHILAQVLHNLPADNLLEMECNYITTFFCDRMKDHHTVTPAVLQGILAIAQMVNKPKDMAVNVLTVMFQHVSCQSLKPEDRRCLFQILQIFIHNDTEELKAFGPDFVFGFMSTVDGERDAHNLLIVFRMLPFFIKTFPLNHLTEEMFEIIACYFPVDYRAESSEKDAVSRDSLAAALLPCLTAIPQFAEYCIPLLLEKLDSKLKLAKLESFNVLIASCDVFTIASMKPFLLDVWRAIQHEVLPGSDKEVRDAGLATLKAIVHMVSVAAVDREEAKLLSTLITYVTSAGLSSLKEVELNLFVPAVRLFLTVAQASSAACQEVIKQVIPVLMKQYYMESGTEQQVTVLGALTSFLAVCQLVHVTPSGDQSVAQLWEDIPALYLIAAQHTQSEIRKEAFHGLAVSAKSLEPDCRQQLYDVLCKQVRQQDQEAVRQEVITCLKELSKLHPDEVMSTIVHSGLQIYEESESLNGSNGMEMFLCMDALCEIANTEPFTSCIVPHMLKCITKSSQADKCLIGLKCLRKLVEAAGADASIHSYLYLKCGAVSRLVSWWMQGVKEGGPPLTFGDVDFILNTAKILDVILKTQTANVQNDVVMEFVPWFVGSSQCLIEKTRFQPLDHSSPWEHTQLVVLLEALLGSVKQDVEIPSLHKLVVTLTQLAIHTSHNVTQKSAARLLANLINKAPNDVHLSKLLVDVSCEVMTAVNNTASTTQEKLSATQLLAWVSKALVMRGHGEVDSWVGQLLELLAHELVGAEAAEGFRLIMEHSEEYLNPSSHCNVRILYRQRFFMVTPKLVASFRDAPESVQANYLVALAHLLQGVPKEVLLMDFQQMVPLLVESLEQKESLLLLTTLGTLENLLEERHDALEDHLQTFIPRILNLARFPGFMKVRVKALQCIHHYCKYPLEKILPFKAKVVQQLGRCLDDPKRLVRREAVRARASWYVVDSPGEGNNS